MTAKFVLVQIKSSSKPEENLALAENHMEAAARRKADLIIFPEYFMTYYPSRNYVKNAQYLDDAFVSEMKKLSTRFGIWTLFGMNEKISEESEKCYNTQVLMDDKGEIRGTYRKTHLFDAFSFQESKQTVPGDTLFSPVETPFGIIGIGTCYDLRFPEVARLQAAGGCGIMIYPSAWTCGPRKADQWSTLLQARAVENEIFVVGCSQFSKGTYIGSTMAAGPDGEVLVRGKEDGEEVIFCEMDLGCIDQMRNNVPVWKQRRLDLY